MYRACTNQHGKTIKRLDTIYIGYEPREQRAVEVLIDSIERHASRPLNIVTLNQLALRRAGLYRRTPHMDSTCWASEPLGDMIDAFDGKPLSTEFSFSRFLVPFMNNYEGFALFMDCDMYFRSDPCKVFDDFADSDGPAIHCVKHHYEDGGGLKRKLYGCPQTKYSRKNWSSVVLWNCGHQAHQNLTVDDVNTKPGYWLHNFMWIEDADIGSLPEEWNWLDGHSDQDIDPVNVHFTSGGPWFSKEAGFGFDCWKPLREGKDVQYADEWMALSSKFD
ncbi:MAG: hypothetical protein BMS9Abin26_1593 [Gammaproteobacteria bacterium]|nr:MAG: hypothetical protein BMS9Abin26_1593 [Gammaproteobacteria bacterium]